MPKLIVFAVFLVLTACQSHKTSQSWELKPEFSSISLISTKNNRVSEIFDFSLFKGSINASGYLSIEIDLNSLKTNIPIRNQRIQKHLFETSIFPTANIHTQLKKDDLSNGVHTIQFDIDMHGVSSMMHAEFMVFEQHGNKVITLHKPLIIQVKDFGLENGIKTLKNIAKLQSINFTVPVNIVLTFNKSK